jgi:hypothetical protein
LSKLKEFHNFLQIPKHGVFITKWTDHAKSKVVAKSMIDVELAGSVWSQESVVES